MNATTLLLVFLAFNVALVHSQWNPRHPSWTDSYSRNGYCWCDSTFDHDLDDITQVSFVINGVARNIRTICDELELHPSYDTFRNGIDPPYNDIQCGNGPPNTAADETGCPGRTDLGSAGCNNIGLLWDVAWLSGRPIFNGATPPPSTTFVLRKGNSMGYALDGDHGAANGQNVYLWSYNANNVNQQWVEIQRATGVYSYQKKNTNFCLDGDDGGSNRQNLRLWACDANDQNQHWNKVSVGGGKFRLEKRNAVTHSIDGNNGGSNAQNVYLWSSSNSNGNQQWFFESV